MVYTGAGDKNFFRQVEQINIEDMQFQSFRSFGISGIGSVNAPLPIPLVVSDLKDLINNNQQYIQNLHDSFCSDIIYKEI